MLDAHDFPPAIRRVGPSGDLKVFMKRFGLNNEGVVPSGHQRVRQALKNSRTVVNDPVGLAVHQLLGADNFCTRRLPDRLMPQTDAK